MSEDNQNENVVNKKSNRKGLFQAYVDFDWMCCLVLVLILVCIFLESLLPHSFGAFITHFYEHKLISRRLVLLDLLPAIASATPALCLPVFLIALHSLKQFYSVLLTAGFMLLACSCFLSSLCESWAALLLAFSTLYGVGATFVLAVVISVTDDYFPYAHSAHVLAASFYQIGYPLASAINNPIVERMLESSADSGNRNYLWWWRRLHGRQLSERDGHPNETWRSTLRVMGTLQMTLGVAVGLFVSHRDHAILLSWLFTSRSSSSNTNSPSHSAPLMRQTLKKPSLYTDSEEHEDEQRPEATQTMQEGDTEKTPTSCVGGGGTAGSIYSSMRDVAAFSSFFEFRKLTGRPQFWTWAAVKFVNYLCWYGLRTNLIVYLHRQLGFPRGHATNYMTLFNLGNVVSGLVCSLLLGDMFRGRLVLLSGFASAFMVGLTGGLPFVPLIRHDSDGSWVSPASLATGVYCLVLGIVVQVSISFGYTTAAEVTGIEPRTSWTATHFALGAGKLLSPLISGLMADEFTQLDAIFYVQSILWAVQTILYLVLIAQVYRCSRVMPDSDKSEPASTSSTLLSAFSNVWHTKLSLMPS